MSDTHPYATMLLRLATHGLAGAAHELPRGPFTEPEWANLLRGVADHRLQGLLAEAVRGGYLDVSERQRRQAGALHQDAMVQMLRLERRLVHAAELLTTEAIDFRVLKGPAVARSAYANPSLRVFGDIDLIIRTERFDDAIDLLMDAGCRRRQPALRSDFDRRFGKGVTMIAPDRVELDVHRTFVMGPFGLTVDLPSLFASSASFELGDLTIGTLDPESMLLHACYTVALGDNPPRLVSLRDTAELILGGRIDPGRFFDLAERSGASAVAALGIARTWDVLQLVDVGPLPEWARGYGPTAVERRWLAAYRRGSYAALAWTSLGAIRGFTDRVAFLRSILLPSRGFLDDRSQGRAVWVWRGVRRMVSAATERS